MQTNQLTELLLQAYEHEKGGVLVYETALKCVVNPDLKEEWTKYLDQTRNHVRVLGDVLKGFEIDGINVESNHASTAQLTCIRIVFKISCRRRQLKE